MVGYCEESRGYRLYDPEKRNIIKSRDVIFFENKFYKDKNNDDYYFLETFVQKKVEDEGRVVEKASPEAEPEDGHETPTEDSGEDNLEENEVYSTPQKACFDSPRIGPGRPKLIRSGNRGRPRKQHNTVNVIVPQEDEVDVNPTTFEEAMSSVDAMKWDEAMKVEYDGLQKNGTWVLVDAPLNTRIIGCKWVFCKKRNSDGSIERYKARLVAKGYSQKYKEDCFETFAPVVRHSCICFILALSAELQLHVHHVDVTAAFLYGDLEEEVYMQQPEGFKQDDRKVCKLKKTLYGLKQAGRQWNKKLNEILLKNDFIRCKTDSCVYILRGTDNWNIVAVYVDDIIISSKTLANINRIKGIINKEFDIVDKGPIENYLGIKVEQSEDRRRISISHEQYILKILEAYQMVDCKEKLVPLHPSHKFSSHDEDCQQIEPQQYQSLIGSLIYLAVTARPEILYSVSKLTQYNNAPITQHFNAAKNIIKYLKKTQKHKLEYKQSGKREIQAYVDADWAGDSLDRKSYTGFCFMFAGGAFSWESRKQPTTTLSSTEAEYIALTQATKETVFVKNFITELGFAELVNSPIILSNDNLSAQHLVRNPVHHPRTKHIDTKFHYIRENYEGKIIGLSYVQTEDMVADIFTKNLVPVKYYKCMKGLGFELNK